MDTAVQETVGKAARENFPVALRLLPARHRRHLMAVYVFARTVDDAGDLAPVAERPALLAGLERDVRMLYAGQGEPRSAAVRGLAEVITQYRLPMAPLVDLIRANQQDQVVTRYATFEDLLGYCELSANPVGRIVLHVFDSYTPERAALSDSICTGLQLAEHWQDVAEDLRAGRVYVPEQDMRRFGCTEADLAATQSSRQARELMAFEVDRARSLLNEGAPLVGTLRGMARVAVAGYVAGGRAALGAIAAAGYDVLGASPRPGKARTATELALAFARGR